MVTKRAISKTLRLNLQISSLAIHSGDKTHDAIWIVHVVDKQWTVSCNYGANQTRTTCMSRHHRSNKNYTYRNHSNHFKHRDYT